MHVHAFVFNKIQFALKTDIFSRSVHN